MERRLVPAWALAVACGVLPLAGCGAGEVVQSIVAPEPTRSEIGTQTFTSLVPGHGLFGGLQIVAPGLLDVTADWTFASNDLDIYLTFDSCATTADLVGGRCAILASSRSFAKPERFDYNVGTGNYRVWVVNFGPGAESGVLHVGITR